MQHLIALSGGDQSGATLDTLPDWLVVRVVNDGGEPLAGTRVTWSSADETARTIAVDQVTNRDGVARAIAVLGFENGEQTYYARVDGLDDSAAFTVRAVRPPGLKALALMNASGADHMCAIDVEGAAWCWGSNSLGQLGDGTITPGDVPRRVQTTQRFRSIAGTWNATCAIALDYTLWCWGQNTYGAGAGAFGDGTEDPSRIPVPGAYGLLVSDIALDYGTACAVTTTAEAWCWGRIITPTGNVGTTLPVRVESTEQWRDISIDGPSRVCAVSMSYEVFCWASDDFAAGVAGLTGDFRRPQRVARIPQLLTVSVSWYEQCGLAATGGRPVCWGYGYTAPRYPRITGSVARLEAREESIMALTNDGRLWIWGELPCCVEGYSASPVTLPGSGPWIDFSMAGSQAFGIRAADSTVYSWFGRPESRELRELIPRPVPAP